jgi:hypothetical protein
MGGGATAALLDTAAAKSKKSATITQLGGGNVRRSTLGGTSIV